MDFVFTVCNRSAAESCPLWPGRPMPTHWGIADPGNLSVPEFEQKTAFHRAFMELHKRVSVFVNRPFESLDQLKLQRRLDGIGRLLPVAVVDEDRSA